MTLTDHQIELGITILLAIIPHAVAWSPKLATAGGILGSILKVLAGNYGSSKNLIDQQDGPSQPMP